MKLVKLKCENCGAKLEVNKDLDKINCNFCGAEILIDDEASELRRVEEVKLQARKQNHEQSIKEKKELEELNAVDNFKKGKLSKLLLIFAALCGIVMFSRGFSVAGFIAFIQTVLFIASWLFGMDIIRHSNKKLYVILAFIGFALIIPFFYLGNKTEEYTYSTNCEKFDWNDVYLNNKLANIDGPIGEIHNNTKDVFYVTFCNVDKGSYEKYRDEMIKKGYVIDAEDNTRTYLAYDEEGYKVYLNWDEKDSELNVDLKVPIKMTEITWPTTGLATKVPQPDSLLGNIYWDNNNNFGVYIGNTTKNDFEKYIIACQNAGFVNNHSKSEKRYSATNDAGYEIVLEYHGYNIMYISVDASDVGYKTESVNSSDNKITNEKSSVNDNAVNDINEIRNDFKEAMDSYEKFMDDYISFMSKYNSDPSDYSLLSDYSNYLSKYSDLMDKFDKWEDENLNEAETNYYIEVQTRVNKKLSDAAL